MKRRPDKPEDPVEVLYQHAKRERDQRHYYRNLVLRSLFIPNEGTAYLLDLLSRMTDENSVSTNDNGVTQTVSTRQGVALNAVVEIKPRVMLRPFRTFLEVEQPESEFLLRVDADKGIGLFECDGGIWKLEAKKNIADYFQSAMGDLIQSGKVVVMQ